jgi:hypothetical protein
VKFLQEGGKTGRDNVKLMQYYLPVLKYTFNWLSSGLTKNYRSPKPEHQKNAKKEE